jgi:hypothetical protein
MYSYTAYYLCVCTFHVGMFVCESFYTHATHAFKYVCVHFFYTRRGGIHWRVCARGVMCSADAQGSLSLSTHIHTCTHTHLHTHIHTYTLTRVCARGYVLCWRSGLPVTQYTHTHLHTHTHSHTHTHLHVCVRGVLRFVDAQGSPLITSRARWKSSIRPSPTKRGRSRTLPPLCHVPPPPSLITWRVRWKSSILL